MINSKKPTKDTETSPSDEMGKKAKTGKLFADPDPDCLRCLPQIHGSIKATINSCVKSLEVELNSFQPKLLKSKQAQYGEIGAFDNTMATLVMDGIKVSEWYQ